MNEIIGNNIMTLRKEHGLTQEQLANALGISYQAVSKWETGNACPDISTLPLLADLFSVSVDQLIGRVPLMTPPDAPYVPDEEPAEVRARVDDLPWPDDDTFYAVLYHGHELVACMAEGSRVLPAQKRFEFHYEGPAQNVSSVFDLEISGDVMGNASAGDDLSCEEVYGGVSAGGDVNAGNVRGGVEAVGDVNCDQVGGDVSAGGDVNCDRVCGSVNAGGDVDCDDVQGNVCAGGDVDCDSVGKTSVSGHSFTVEYDVNGKTGRYHKDLSSLGKDLGQIISSAVKKAYNYNSDVNVQKEENASEEE